MTLTRADRRTETDPDARRSPRVPTRRAVGLAEPYSGRTIDAVACDVSSGGLCLRVEAGLVVRPGRLVTLYDAPRMGPRLCETDDRGIVAQVVWTARDPSDPSALRVGLRLHAGGGPVAA